MQTDDLCVRLGNCPSEGVGRQVLVVVHEPVGIAVGMGSEHEQKTQYLQRALKPVDHRVGVKGAIGGHSVASAAICTAVLPLPESVPHSC